MEFDVIVIGGGAAGFFSAIHAKLENPKAKVIIVERANVLLSKVRISGGGRCNVTHSCFDPKILVGSYPRGAKALLGPFSRFGPKETIDWFGKRGVVLKQEADGRMFPTTDRSETVIDCLLKEAHHLDIPIWRREKILAIKQEGDSFVLKRPDDEVRCHSLILATGSHPSGYKFAEKLGHSVIPLVPSLFTFNVPGSPLSSLSGISFEKVEVKLGAFKLMSRGPLLITHFGFSGPAVLKLSAFAARHLHSKDYREEIFINWIPEWSFDASEKVLLDLKNAHQHKSLFQLNPFTLPKNFWRLFLENFNIEGTKKVGQIADKDLRRINEQLHRDLYLMKGKTTHKEEFVTSGGIDLLEVDMKTMQSKICPRLFFAGEILDIDGITGGFNFQNAWTTGYLAGASSALNDHTHPE